VYDDDDDDDDDVSKKLAFLKADRSLFHRV
jgi:hypothetical protein